MSLSKAFRFCDTTNEALNIISKIFESNNKVFLTKNEEELFLNMKINLPTGDEQEIKLILRKIESMENATKDELLEKIKILEEENKKLKDEINKLKKDNIKKDNIIKSLTKNQNNNITEKNEEGFCDNAKITIIIENIDLKNKIEGIKNLFIKIIYNNEIREIEFDIEKKNEINKIFEL